MAKNATLPGVTGSWSCPAKPSMDSQQLRMATCSNRWRTCSKTLASRQHEEHIAKVLARSRAASPCGSDGCEGWWGRRRDMWLESVAQAERARLMHHFLSFEGQFLPRSDTSIANDEGSMLRRRDVGGGEGVFGPFDYFEPEFSCPLETRVPHAVGDGPKWVCGAELFPAPCRIVSLGSNFDDLFERGMATASGCSSYVVDPTLRANPARAAAFERGLGALRGSRLNTSVGVGSGTLDFRGTAYPLVGIGTLLSDRFAGEPAPLHLSVLKIDIEGEEFGVLRDVWSLCAKGKLALDQLNVEVHLWRKRLRYRDVYALFDGARRCGLALHHKERNGWACEGWVCGEFSFVSLRHARRVYQQLMNDVRQADRVVWTQ